MNEATATQQTAEQRYHQIATELFNANGKRPTIAQVREASGSGSFSTITKAMQTWQQALKNEAEELSEAKKDLELADLPPELSEKIEGLTGVINGVILEAWGVASKQAETSIALAQQKNEEALAAATAAATEKLEEAQAQAELAQAELASEADNLADNLVLAKKQNEELPSHGHSTLWTLLRKLEDFGSAAQAAAKAGDYAQFFKTLHLINKDGNIKKAGSEHFDFLKVTKTNDYAEQIEVIKGVKFWHVSPYEEIHCYYFSGQYRLEKD